MSFPGYIKLTDERRRNIATNRNRPALAPRALEARSARQDLLSQTERSSDIILIVIERVTGFSTTANDDFAQHVCHLEPPEYSAGVLH